MASPTSSRAGRERHARRRPGRQPLRLLDGGADTDTVSYASRTDGVEILLGVPSGAEDTVVNVENAMGGSGDDKMVGTDGPNAFFGNGGNDGLQGNGGDDSPLRRR